MAHTYKDLDGLTHCPDCGTKLQNTDVNWCGESENVNFCPKCDVGSEDVCPLCEEQICVCDQLEDASNDDSYPLIDSAEAKSELVHFNQVCKELHMRL